MFAEIPGSERTLLLRAHEVAWASCSCWFPLTLESLGSDMEQPRWLECITLRNPTPAARKRAQPLPQSETFSAKLLEKIVWNKNLLVPSASGQKMCRNSGPMENTSTTFSSFPILGKNEIYMLISVGRKEVVFFNYLKYTFTRKIKSYVDTNNKNNYVQMQETVKSVLLCQLTVTLC